MSNVVLQKGGCPMLVLTRKTGETITIDGDIKIQIVGVKGKQVRVGIEAPKNKEIKRGELINQISTLPSENFNVTTNTHQNSL